MSYFLGSEWGFSFGFGKVWATVQFLNYNTVWFSKFYIKLLMLVRPHIVYTQWKISVVDLSIEANYFPIFSPNTHVVPP